MNDAHLWAAIALLALGGWAFTNVRVTHGLLPQANALNVLGKLDAIIDERIRVVVERVTARAERRPPGDQPRAQTQARNAATEELERAFGGMPLSPIGEQPDSDQRMEVVEG